MAVLIILFFFYCCAGWGYIVAFTKVLTIYQIYLIHLFSSTFLNLQSIVTIVLMSLSGSFLDLQLLIEFFPYHGLQCSAFYMPNVSDTGFCVVICKNFSISLHIFGPYSGTQLNYLETIWLFFQGLLLSFLQAAHPDLGIIQLCSLGHTLQSTLYTVQYVGKIFCPKWREQKLFLILCELQDCLPIPSQCFLSCISLPQPHATLYSLALCPQNFCNLDFPELRTVFWTQSFPSRTGNSKQ
jgi:hypothetical protein